jgi:hypothetical protein
MDATKSPAYNFAVSNAERAVRVGLRSKHLWRKTWRATRQMLPPRAPLLLSREGKLLATAWTLAALTTLGVALAQGVRMFLLSLLAVMFGTLAALWMLNGLARR